MKNARSTALLPSLEHVVTLSDNTGIIQHATGTVPNRSTGYCTDDVARAFIVALMRLRAAPRDEAATRLASIYLSFLHDAQLDDGRFHNFMSYQRDWLDDIGSEDCFGRAMWALGYGVRYAPTQALRRLCGGLLDRGLGAIDTFEYPNPRAYTILGLAHAYETRRETPYAAGARYLADALARAYEAERGDDWEWFTATMTFDNARLSEAMIRAGSTLGHARYGEIGMTTLGFYEGVTIQDGTYVPIGNRGWYQRGGDRAVYAQQPLEASALIDAELAAFDSTGDGRHIAAAELGLAWFYGKNSRSETMAHGGGCYDGLDEHDVNRNMGAESTLALLAGAYAMGERQNRTLRAVNR